MTPLLPSTQLLLALWLLATVAPAATALMNGSVMPFAVTEHRAKVAVREAAGVAEAEDDSEEDETHFDWMACDRAGSVVAFHQPMARGSASCHSRHVEAALATSVLQTDLQRHRPKVA
jgi:hypothetical protein